MSFVRYSLVGIIATLSHYLIMVVAVELLSLRAVLASAMGALTGAVLAYLGNSYFTFNRPNSHPLAMLKFFSVALLAGCAIQCCNGLVWPGHSRRTLSIFPTAGNCAGVAGLLFFKSKLDI